MKKYVWIFCQQRAGRKLKSPTRQFHSHVGTQREGTQQPELRFQRSDLGMLQFHLGMKSKLNERAATKDRGTARAAGHLKKLACWWIYCNPSHFPKRSCLRSLRQLAETAAVWQQVCGPKHAVAQLSKICSVGQLLGLEKVHPRIAFEVIPERNR